MREILFRGQTRRKGEKVRMDGTPVESNWVYGGVLQGTGDHSIIYQTEPDIEKKVVYTDTIGQFTGLTDKNDTRIFEGDICKAVIYGFTCETGVVGEARYEDGTFEFTCEYGDFYIFCVNDENFEVIGNIYDNPELLREDGKRNG